MIISQRRTNFYGMYWTLARKSLLRSMFCVEVFFFFFRKKRKEALTKKAEFHCLGCLCEFINTRYEINSILVVSRAIDKITQYFEQEIGHWLGLPHRAANELNLRWNLTKQETM